MTPAERLAALLDALDELEAAVVDAAGLWTARVQVARNVVSRMRQEFRAP